MAGKNKFKCPECGSKLKVWSDLNVSVEYEVGANGSLSKRVIETEETGEEREGIKCTSCSWESFLGEHGSSDFSLIYENLGELIEGMELTAKRPKN